MPRVLEVNPNFCMARAPNESMFGLSGSSSAAKELVLSSKVTDAEAFHNDIGLYHLSSVMRPLSISDTFEDTFRPDSKKTQITKSNILTPPKRHRRLSPIGDSSIHYKCAKSIQTSYRSPEPTRSPNELLSIERMDRILQLRRRRNLQHYRDANRDENTSRDGSFLTKRLFETKENKLPEDLFVPLVGGAFESDNRAPSKFVLKPRMKRKTGLSPRNNNRLALQSIKNRRNFPKAA